MFLYPIDNKPLKIIAAFPGCKVECQAARNEYGTGGILSYRLNCNYLT